MTTDHNRKLPANPFEDKNKRYPYLHGEGDVNGGRRFTYRDPSDHTLASSETLLPSGSYETVEYHEERGELRTNLNPGDTRTYTVGGASSQTDGHMDLSVGSTMRTNITGDASVVAGRNMSTGVSGQNINMTGELTINRTTGKSESKVYNSSAGDSINEHEGNYHEAFRKNLVTSVTRNNILMVNEGDYAVHVQSGNYDTHVRERVRLYADNDILIESATKITLKVGDSTIVIDPSNIAINSDRVDIN